MAYEHKPGQFSLFRTKNKKHEKTPDYTGNGKALDGSEIEVAAWLKGTEPQFLSCTFKIAQSRTEQPKAKPERNPGDDDDMEPF